MFTDIYARGQSLADRLSVTLRIAALLLMAGSFASSSGARGLADDASTDSGVLQLSPEIRAQCLRTIRAGLQSDEFWPSIHAAEALTLGGHGAEVRSFLEPKLATEKDDQKRCGISRELVRAGDWQKATVMLEILAGDDPHGHVHAAESLYKVGELGDGQAMRKAATQTKDVRLQLMASAALARGGDLAAMQVLRTRLADKDAEVRRIAGWILGRIGDQQDIPQLRKNVEAAADPLARGYQQHALAALGDPAGLKALLQNLQSDDTGVKTYAAVFAGDSRATSASPALIKLLDDPNVDVRVRAAQSLLVLSRPATEPHVTQLVYPATEAHPRNTEGSILRLADDSLLCAVTRFGGGSSDFSAAEIVARRSRDGGQTWGEPRVLQERTGKLNVMSVTLRRLHHTPRPTIAMFYLQKNAYDDLRVMVRYSHDEAESFGKPIQVTTESGYHVMNNDRVTQLASGRILVPVASTPDVHKVNHFICYCWLSDDGGQTWRKSKGQVDQPKRGAMEPEVVELKDGRVMMIARTQLGYIATSYSTDQGNQWSKPSRLSTLQAPEAPATLRRIPATGDLLLIWNNTFAAGAGHGGLRTPLTSAISTDEGKTWKHIRNLETRRDRTYSYTSLMFVKDRALMSYWERDGKNLATRFRAVPIAWFYETPKSP